MRITVNGKEVETQSPTLFHLSKELALPAQGVAAAVNNRMIPRPEWDSCPLSEGASVVIIKAACGG